MEKKPFLDPYVRLAETEALFSNAVEASISKRRWSLIGSGLFLLVAGADVRSGLVDHQPAPLWIMRGIADLTLAVAYALEALVFRTQLERAWIAYLTDKAMAPNKVSIRPDLQVTSLAWSTGLRIEFGPF